MCWNSMRQLLWPDLVEVQWGGACSDQEQSERDLGGAVDGEFEQAEEEGMMDCAVVVHVQAVVAATTMAQDTTHHTLVVHVQATVATTMMAWDTTHHCVLLTLSQSCDLDGPVASMILEVADFPATVSGPAVSMILEFADFVATVSGPAAVSAIQELADFLTTVNVIDVSHGVHGNWTMAVINELIAGKNSL